MSKRNTTLIVIAILALIQGALGVLRGLHWFDVGSDLFGQGLLLLPMVGLLAILRGALVAAIALMYVVFACGAFLSRRWAKWVGIVVAGITLLMVAGVAIQGEPPVRALVWAIVPVIMIGYLLSPAATQTLNSNREG